MRLSGRDYSPAKIEVAHLSPGQQTVYYQGLRRLQQIRFDEADNLYIVNQSRSIFGLNRSGGLVEVVRIVIDDAQPTGLACVCVDNHRNLIASTPYGAVRLSINGGDKGPTGTPALLAEASAQAGQTTEGLVALAEALAAPTYEKPRDYSRHWREGNGQDKRHLDESVAGVQTVCSQSRRRACRLLLSMQTTEVVGMPEETAYQDFMTHCRAIWSRLVPPGEEVPLFKKR